MLIYVEFRGIHVTTYHTDTPPSIGDEIETHDKKTYKVIGRRFKVEWLHSQQECKFVFIFVE